jgi:hypothetical protein
MLLLSIDFDAARGAEPISPNLVGTSPNLAERTVWFPSANPPESAAERLDSTNDEMPGAAINASASGGLDEGVRISTFSELVWAGAVFRISLVGICMGVTTTELMGVATRELAPSIATSRWFFAATAAFVPSLLASRTGLDDPPGCPVSILGEAASRPLAIVRPVPGAPAPTARFALGATFKGRHIAG